MAATNYIPDGGVFLFYLGGTAVAYSTSVSFGITHNPREIRNKDDGRWPILKEGTYDGTGTVNVLYAFLDDAGSATESIAEIFAALIAGAAVTCKISNANSGDKEFNFSAMLTGQNITLGELGTNLQGDFSFRASGAPTLDIIA